MAIGGILARDTTQLVTQTGPGDSGQVLTSNGAGVVPTFQDLPASGGGGWIEGLMRTVGDGAETAFPLPDVAESLLFASVAGLIVDPLTYTLTGSDDEITFDVAPGMGDVITVNYVTASA